MKIGQLQEVIPDNLKCGKIKYHKKYIENIFSGKIQRFCSRAELLEKFLQAKGFLTFFFT